MAKKKNLVIVESPAKARTLSKILGKDYNLKASMGHVRDLPKSRLGVDVENEFEPKYVVPRVKSKLVKELKDAAKKASVIYLATDPDREGEAISWHIAEVTKGGKVPYHRVAFHEITKEAIERAFKRPRAIDTQLVNAQQARRVLDRLVGYKISPLLWRNVRRGLSAGRVQSVALKIIVDREREIQKFKPEEYWIVEAELSQLETEKKILFRAHLTGLIDGTKLDIHTKDETDDICGEIESAKFSVIKVKTRKVNRQPAPPFITSTLQQEAWRKLHFSARQTMAVAQQLYEGLSVGNEGSVGLITYMRTDSTRVTRSAITETREVIAHKYGVDFTPSHARSFLRRVQGAQEAHEAIRPTSIRREPAVIKQYLSTPQFRLYELIWKRMVASQMAAAVFSNTTSDIKAKNPVSKVEYLLHCSCSVNTFPGFLMLYTEGKDEDDSGEEKTGTLPKLERGDALELMGLFPEQHFTQPSPRYTEASLIKILEQWGIGRPSTYAPTLSTIQAREYVNKARGSLRPTELGFVVSDLLAKHFANVVNIKFTAEMEKGLDKVAQEKGDWVSLVRDFYTPFAESLDSASQVMEKVKLEDEETDEVCPKCGKSMVVKFGRFGKFLACSGYPECKSTKPFQVKTGVKCPECGSELVQKVSKKKRTFYGCSNYPKCTFATNSKPIAKPCPKCGGLLTFYRGKQAKCVKCNYKGKL
ncbi:type I DNA topoisomerase [Chloroflexota bacterium]